MASKNPFAARIAAALLIGITAAACATGRYAETNKINRQMVKSYARELATLPPSNQQVTGLAPEQQQYIGTINFGLRKPSYVIIHHTAQDSLEQTIRTFTLARTKVSAHYVVGRNGMVVHMLNDYFRAWHAGVSMWGRDRDINSSSIGIELDNNGHEPWPPAQINSLLKLLANLKTRYDIPAANFIGHMDIAPGRKPDPANFPWKTLADAGFGYWYDDMLQPAPTTLDARLAFKAIGYNVKSMPQTITAFKQHFIQTDISPVLTQRDSMVLNNLYVKYLQ